LDETPSLSASRAVSRSWCPTLPKARASESRSCDSDGSRRPWTSHHHHIFPRIPPLGDGAGRLRPSQASQLVARPQEEAATPRPR
jgi:hypothetical protein